MKPICLREIFKDSGIANSKGVLMRFYKGLRVKNILVMAFWLKVTLVCYNVWYFFFVNV